MSAALPEPEPDVRELLAAGAERRARAAAGTPEVDAVRAGEANVLPLQRRAVAALTTEDLVVPADGRTVRARVYRPAPGPLPVLLYLHGGGFVSGPDGYDAPLRELALASGCLVVALRHRLAPEDPYPAAVEDAVAAAAWLATDAGSLVGLGGRAGPFGIAGDSSGGNLAAVVTNRLARAGAPPAYQALVYPMLDATGSGASYRDRGHGFGFDAERARWYFDQYLPGEIDRHDPSVSPLFEPVVSGLPPTLIAFAGLDPLRDDSVRYAARLRAQGVPVDVWERPGTIHGFLQMTAALQSGRDLVDMLGDWIRARTQRFSASGSMPR